MGVGRWTRVTVQQILQQGYAAFAQSHPLPGLCAEGGSCPAGLSYGGVGRAMCSAAPTGIMSGSGTTHVGTGCAPHVPGCRSSAGWTNRGRACWPATITM